VIRKAIIMILLAAVSLAPNARAADSLEERVSALEEQMQDDSSFRAYWKEGLRLDSADGAFKLKIGGRVMFDWNCFLGEDEGMDAAPFDDGLEFRRLRFYSEGTIYDNTEYKLQIDFAGGSEGSSLKDAYIGVKELLPFANFKVGKFHEPFSIDELTSSKYMTFMERALPTNTFAPSRSGGVMLYDAVDSFTWAAGLFRPLEDDNTWTGTQGYAFTGRVTYAPWGKSKTDRASHLGLAYTWRGAESDGSIRSRQRPSLHLANRLVDTGSIDYDSEYRVGFEGALVYGPFAAQGEYVYTGVDRETGGALNFGGYYVEGSYFLTGEHRSLDNKSGQFSRTKPNDNYTRDGGPGAWQVGVRYACLDLVDDDIDGGRLSDITLGLNWYLNPNVRVMFNYLYAMAEEGNYGANDGDIQGFGTRFQVDF